MMDVTFESVNRLYAQGYGIKTIAGRLNISESKVTKILVTLGHAPTDTARLVKKLLAEGKTQDQIAAVLGISPKSLSKYIPYEKGMYRQEYPSKNAIKIRKSRENKP